MVNKIIDGISIKINELFGDNYYIYSENVKQGFKEPCFFISLLKPSSTPKLGNRSLREYNFGIQYFPSSSNSKNTEMYEVSEKLISGLEYISFENKLLRGSNINAEIVDDVLHFFIKYSLFVVQKEEDEELFGSLKLIQKLKS